MGPESEEIYEQLALDELIQQIACDRQRAAAQQELDSETAIWPQKGTSSSPSSPGSTSLT